MPSALPAVQLLPRPERGRVFSLGTAVRLGDVDTSGRLRLDATARLLQDVANDDASEARLDRRYGWLVRRTMIEVTRVPRLGEGVEVSTWCTGIGRAWAERRSSIVGDRGGSIDAVSLWVQVDVTTSRPARISSDFRDAYDAAAGGRSISSRLSLPAEPGSTGPEDPPPVTARWHVRRTDLDPWGHVNNAASWAVVEEHVDLGEGDADREGRAEMEYLHPVEADGDHLDVVVAAARDARHDDTTVWLARSGIALVVGRWSPIG
ncbi:acyl-[acyl-carrier-protein] thioesterase [Ilumatobacter sp.]|uniref:acyl-[acyl-carrier-protein] thioesterase n=1 Tax=Ilumatobacter sp. TaxID=1967498 RepID=UPI003B521BC9